MSAVAAPALPSGPLDAGSVLRLYEQAGGLQRGHFVLSSGNHSDTYLQSAVVLQWPWVAEALGRALAQPYQGAVDAVAGPALGAVVIAHEVARALGVRMVFAERSGGVMTLRRSLGLRQGERVLLVEDVVSTGGSLLEVRDLVVAAGAEPAGLAAIIDRRPAPQGAEPSFPVRSLARVRAAIWAPDRCPLCAQGQPTDSPGSKRLVDQPT